MNLNVNNSSPDKVVRRNDMRKGVEMGNDAMCVCTGNEGDYKRGGTARIIPK